MFTYDRSPFEVPVEFGDVSRRTWLQIAAPGTWWDGTDRVAIAETSRAARIGMAPGVSRLPEAAIEVCGLIGATPSVTTEAWVAEMVAELGEARYVETVSIASRVVSIDSFSRLVGSPLEPFPEPIAGRASFAEADPRARKNQAWIAIVGFPTPRNAFSTVPPEAAAMVDITDGFYMPEFDMQYPNFKRMGLHRTQIETVAGVTSHANECFY